MTENNKIAEKKFKIPKYIHICTYIYEIFMCLRAQYC